MTIYLFICLGRDCHLLLGRWWKTIHLFIWEGMVIYLPNHLVGKGHNLPIHVEVDGQLPIYIEI